jgi:hypothetical protein
VDGNTETGGREVSRVKTRFALSLAMVAALAAAATPAVLAQEGTTSEGEPEGIQQDDWWMQPISATDFGLVPNSALVEGQPKDFWVEQLGDWFALTPFDEHYGPMGDCQAHQDGPVFFLSNIPFGMFEIYDCVIEPDKHILIDIGGGFGLSDEPDETLEVMSSGSRDNAFTTTDPFLIIDGQKVPVGGSMWHERPAREIELPEGNLFGLPPGPYNTAGNGWYVMLEPLSPGHHTILVGDETIMSVIRPDDFDEDGNPTGNGTRGWETLTAFVAFDDEVPDGEAEAESMDEDMDDDMDDDEETMDDAEADAEAKEASE